MANIWFTSDLHLGHDKEFVWKERGFENVQQMNEAIVKRLNSKVAPEDTLYILGDVMLGDNSIGEKYFSQINGKKIIIIGNHDTNARIEIYKKYVERIVYADKIKYAKHLFYLSHYPTLTTNYDNTVTGKAVINLFGHTHQKENFFKYNDDMLHVNPFMYHVGVDSHDCYPVNIIDIIDSIKEKLKGE